VKALSVQEPWASMICSGVKTIEGRTWATRYRGDLLICTSAKMAPDWEYLGKTYQLGIALCIVELVDCRLMTRADELTTWCSVYQGAYAWVLGKVRPVTPVRVKGRQRLFEVEFPPEVKP